MLPLCAPCAACMPVAPSPIPAGCQSDNECPLTEACYNRECQDPCRYLTCGANAECGVNAHNAICTCHDSYRGNPYHECKRYECLVDQDCQNHLKCEDQKCVDPCACAANAECKARDHRGICNCIPGMGFLNILCLVHTTFQPNEGIMWSYLSNAIPLFG